MRIAVNAQTLVQGKMEGLGWYSYETLKRIISAHPEHHFTLIFGKGIHPEFSSLTNVTCVNIGPSYFRPLAWLLKFEVFVPNFINRGSFDLFLSTDGWSSTRIKTKSVVVIHDINFEHYPAFSPWSNRIYYQYFFKRWARKATHIATVSEYSKSDIATTYGINSSNITVTLNGASELYRPSSIDEQTLVRNDLTNGVPYFIFVGALHPRKNIINLFKAFDAFKKAGNKEKLVIIGEKFYWDNATKQTYENLEFKDEIVFKGRLNQPELVKVVGASLALVYVSLFEGFGIPLVEAMNCGVPIITSNTTSMPEIAGDAALIINPHSVNEIAEAMQSMATNSEMRQKLIMAGNSRKAQFSWDKTANSLWHCISEVLKD